MPKMQVYLPGPLYEQVKAQGARLNVSGILQDALDERLAELTRLDALAAAIEQHEAESGPLAPADLAPYWNLYVFARPGADPATVEPREPGRTLAELGLSHPLLEV